MTPKENLSLIKFNLLQQTFVQLIHTCICHDCGKERKILKSQNLTETHTAQKRERKTAFPDFLLIQVVTVYTCPQSWELTASSCVVLLARFRKTERQRWGRERVIEREREEKVFSILGEGNGNPLQYSCLENPMGGGAWWAAVHGVAQSRTRLKRLSSSSSSSSKIWASQVTQW